MLIHLSGIATQIWNDKYRFTGNYSIPSDNSVEDTFRRVANACASAEAPNLRLECADKFYSIMEKFEFIPAGRILAGAGTGRSVTLFNCFVAGQVADSISGIFQSIKEAAETLQQGGGIGFDFSTLRSRGALVRGIGADASGPLSFMDVYDSMCDTVMSAAGRRGAMMAVLRIDHPDIEEFIEAKQTPGRLTKFNLSVAIPDAFMHAVENDLPWELKFDGKVYKTIPARELWEKLTRATYDYAEPGVLFSDTINQMNNLAYCEDLTATNPCGEQPLPPYGACNLGSINLAALVRNPFSPDAYLDISRLEEVTTTAVRMLDNVHDITRFPLEAQRIESQAKRRIGLGITGLADALTMCQVRYGCEPAISLTKLWVSTLAETAYTTSIHLAKEKGSFPAFNREEYIESKFLNNLLSDIREDIYHFGIRNSHLTSIAPTGTISLFAGNISSGIEPTFAHRYERKVLNKDGTRRTEIVESPALAAFERQFGKCEKLPDYFVTAMELTPAEHIAMQAAAQPYIDSAISKTTNVPEDISYEAFKDVYRLAYASGLKGCTTYRPTAIRGSVLSEIKPTETGHSEVRAEKTKEIGQTTALVPRPSVLSSCTYKLKPAVAEHALYITISNYLDGDSLRPYEIFFNSKNIEHYAWSIALARMISAVFRRGGDVSFVAEELKAVFDPKGGFWDAGRYQPSLLASIGQVIEAHMATLPLAAAEGLVTKVSAYDEKVPEVILPAKVPNFTSVPAFGCPKCFQPLRKSEGCEKCDSCGYSKCG